LAEPDQVAALVKEAANFLMGVRSGYIKDLQLTKLRSEDLDRLLRTGRVTTAGVASLPFHDRPELSVISAAAKHEVFFVALHTELRSHEVDMAARFNPFQSSKVHHSTEAVIIEFDSSSKLNMSLTRAEYVCKLDRSNPAAARNAEITLQDLTQFLKGKGLTPDSHRQVRFGSPGADFTTIYMFARRFALENDYQMETTNCKAFCNTLLQSCLAGEYRFRSDANADKLKKKVARFVGARSSSKDGNAFLGLDVEYAKPFKIVRNWGDNGNWDVSFYSPHALEEGRIPKPGHGGRLVNFTLNTLPGFYVVRATAPYLPFSLELAVFADEYGPGGTMSTPLRGLAANSCRLDTLVEYMAFAANSESGTDDIEVFATRIPKLPSAISARYTDNRNGIRLAPVDEAANPLNYQHSVAFAGPSTHLWYAVFQ